MRRLRLGHQYGDPGIRLDVLRLHIVGPGNDGETAFGPFVPDRGQQGVPILSTSREDGQNRLFEQIAEIGDVQVFSHVEEPPVKLLPAPSRRLATISAWASTKSCSRGFTPNSAAKD